MWSTLKTPEIFTQQFADDPLRPKAQSFYVVSMDLAFALWQMALAWCLMFIVVQQLTYGIGLVPLSRAQLSKDNTSVSVPSNNSCLMRKEILPHFDCLEMENVNIIVRRAEFSLNVEKKVQSPDWLCCVSGFIPFAGI